MRCSFISANMDSYVGIFALNAAYMNFYPAQFVIVIVIVIVNSRFLERPQKRSRRNQLIHRRLIKTKSIGSGQDPESQAGRQSDGYGGWCLEFRRVGRYQEDDKSG